MKLEIWEGENGVVPVRDFIVEQPPKAQAKILKIMGLLQEKGESWMLNSPYMKKLSGFDLYELRIINGGIIYRILFVIAGGVAWMLHGFIKKSQKTPACEIQVAETRRELLKLQLQAPVLAQKL